MLKHRRLIKKIYIYLAILGLRFAWRLAEQISWEKNSGFGKWLGDIAFTIAKKHRLQALYNLNLVYGDTISLVEKMKIIHQMFRNMGSLMMEVLKLHSMTPQEVLTLVDTSSVEPLIRESFARNRSVMVITGHYGNWELFASCMTLLGKVHVFAKKNENPEFEDFLHRTRKTFKIGVLDRNDKKSALALRKMSQEPGRIIGILMDVDTRVHGVFSPFLGIPANTPSGPASIACKDWFDVYAGFCVRRPDGTFFIEFDGPLKHFDTGDKDRDIQVTVDMYNELISNRIFKDPTQWIWIHKRWRRRPGDAGTQ